MDYPIKVYDDYVTRDGVYDLVCDPEYMTTMVSSDDHSQLPRDYASLMFSNEKPRRVTVLRYRRSHVHLTPMKWKDWTHARNRDDMKQVVVWMRCTLLNGRICYASVKRDAGSHCFSNEDEVMLMTLPNLCPECNTQPTPTVRGMVCHCLKECDNCGAEFPDNTMTEVDLDLLCPDCREDMGATCMHCNEWVYSNSLSEVVVGVDRTTEEWCEDCVGASAHTCTECDDVVLSDDMGDLCPICDTTTSECHECGDRYDNDNMSVVNDEYVCERCLNREYYWCESCGEYHHRDERGDCGESSERMHEYNYKPRPIFHRTEGDNNYPSRLYMGVELEVEDGDDLPNQLYDQLEGGDVFAYCKYDGSLNRSGVEIVTHPCTLDYHKTQAPWKEITKLAVGLGYRSYSRPNCGLHVHVNRSHFTQAELIKMALLVYNAEHEYQILAQRRSSSYSQFKKVKAHKSLLSDNELRDRYTALNFTNKNTVEFRMFKGTLGTDTILATLELVQVTCNVVKVHSVTEVLNKKWSLVWNYVDQNRKAYPYLTQFMVRKHMMQREEKVTHKTLS